MHSTVYVLLLSPRYHEDIRGQGRDMFLFPGAFIIRSQIHDSSCSYVIALKSSVSRRKAVSGAQWKEMENRYKKLGLQEQYFLFAGLQTHS